MTEPVTATALRDEILDAGRKLRAAVDAYRTASANYVRIKHEQAVAWDTAFLDAKGTEQTKKSLANLATAQQTLEHEQALEAKRAARLEMEAWQSMVSAYQSIAAATREEMRLSR